MEISLCFISKVNQEDKMFPRRKMVYIYCTTLRRESRKARKHVPQKKGARTLIRLLRKESGAHKKANADEQER